MLSRSRLAIATFLIMAASLLSSLPIALAVDIPVLDAIVSPVDAPKAFIRGTTEPGFKVIVIGGSYDIPPITADNQGRFEIQVALIQESQNLYSIKVEDPVTHEFSEEIQVTIIEGVAEAAAAEAGGGGDRTAPEAPTLDQNNQTVDTSSFKFTGTGEAGATLIVAGSQKRTLKIKNDGTFTVSFNLKKDQVNTFDFNIKDAAGNLGPAVRVVITHESSEEAEAEGEDEMGNTEDDVVEEEMNLRPALQDIANHWAKDYVEQLVDRGVVSGYDDGTFRPDAQVSRAEFAKMVLVALDYEIAEPPLSENPFSDVDASAWYAPYVAEAKEAGITSGYSDGTFKPDRPIQRAEALKMLFLAANIEVEAEGSSEFPDIAESDWFFGYVKKARELGIVGGYANGSFGPADPMTRGQVAKVIIMLLEQL